MTKRPSVMDKFNAMKAIKNIANKTIGTTPLTLAERIRKTVKKYIRRFDDYINGIVEALDNLTKRLCAIEELVADEEAEILTLPVPDENELSQDEENALSQDEISEPSPDETLPPKDL